VLQRFEARRTPSAERAEQHERDAEHDPCRHDHEDGKQ
jgi:hypothetical protein